MGTIPHYLAITGSRTSCRVAKLGSLANIKFGKRVIIYDGGVTRLDIKVSILYQEFLRLMPPLILAALCLQLAGRLVLSTIQD